MFKRIDHVEIVPSNADRSIEFYVNALGFEIRQEMPVDIKPLRRILYLGLGDTMLEIIDVKNPAPPSGSEWQVGYRNMALEVDDMTKTLESLRGFGVKPSWGPVDLGDSIRVEIKDPDGLPIELREWRRKPGERNSLNAQE